MSNVLYLADHTPGLKAYTPELGERKPHVKMEAMRGHYGKHVFVDTPEILKGRGIEHLRTYTADDLTTAGQYKAGWRSYRVTNRAFEVLRQKYAISMAIHLD